MGGGDADRGAEGGGEERDFEGEREGAPGEEGAEAAMSEAGERAREGGDRERGEGAEARARAGREQEPLEGALGLEGLGGDAAGGDPERQRAGEEGKRGLVAGGVGAVVAHEEREDRDA